MITARSRQADKQSIPVCQPPRDENRNKSVSVVPKIKPNLEKTQVSYDKPKDYCLSILGGASKVLMNKLYRIQKRAARIILNAKIDTSSRKLFNISDWMIIFQRVNFNRCIIMFKILNGYMPVNLRKYFIAKCLNSHNLRSCLSSQHVLIPFVKTNLVKNSFLYNGPFLWNHLPDQVLIVTSLSHFKHV